MERPREVSLGQAGPCWWAGGHQPPPQQQRNNLDPGGCPCAETVHQRSAQETEAIQGVVGRKGFNAGNRAPGEPWEQLKVKAQGCTPGSDFRDNKSLSMGRGWGGYCSL